MLAVALLVVSAMEARKTLWEIHQVAGAHWRRRLMQLGSVLSPLQCQSRIRKRIRARLSSFNPRASSTGAKASFGFMDGACILPNRLIVSQQPIIVEISNTLANLPSTL
ncbi:hypothetical protein F4782DRAFT_337878 [Xylaria castorea]|nr:hypothetical protein F4782DRAFT_337878 [Xylaria castorea]